MHAQTFVCARWFDVELCVFVSGTSIRIDYFKAYARDNFTFKCPDANENTLIEYLEWHYESRRQKILEYHKDAGTTLFNGWNGRVGLDPEYGLIFSNVTFADTGYYMCLINHRLLPDVVIRFTVIGEYNSNCNSN